MDALIKLVLAILFFMFIFGMMIIGAYNAVQVGLLKSQIYALNQVWENANQSTTQALENVDFIKKTYAKSFYNVLSIVKNNKNECLTKETPITVQKNLHLPPVLLNKLINKNLRYVDD